MPVTHADLKTVVEFKHIRKMGISYIKSSKSRSPRRAGGILAQGRSLVNRASSLCTSQCHDLRPSSFWRRFGPIFEPGQQGLLTLHFRVPWSPRCHRFEEVSFFRVSFHSFRQKRDSPSECPEQGAGKSREMSRRSVKDWTFARGGGGLFNSSAGRGCMYLAYLSTVND